MRRFVFIFGFLFLALLTKGFSADGTYQRTKDGQAKVWNNRPQPGDAATWSGKRDAAGYATGRGTLTWFTTEQKIVTGSNIPLAQHNAGSRYTGDMIKGKFAGMVEGVDSHGRTFHGNFVDGHRGRDWTFGPVPAADRTLNEESPAPIIAASPKPNESPELKLAEKIDTSQRPMPEMESASPEPPAEGPPQSRPAPSAQRPQPNDKKPADTAVDASTEYDESLRSLVGPPSGLHVNAAPSATPQISPPSQVAITAPITAPSSAPTKLNAAQVIEIADAEARAHGYNLGDFQHPQAQFNADDNSWSVLYDRKSVDSYGMAAVGQHFSVAVDDKTKKTTFAPEK